VAPSNFKGIETILEPDFWAPVMMQHEIHPGDDLLSSRTTYWIYAVGRLKPGVTSSQGSPNSVCWRSNWPKLTQRITKNGERQ
jgi:hypothetical protein